MIKILLIALAVIVAGSAFGWQRHEEQLNKAAVQKASLSSCELANQALQQKFHKAAFLNSWYPG